MTTLSSKLRWGILGCARISRRGLIPGLKASRTGELVAIASRNAATAGEWAEEFTIPRSHGTYEAMIADPAIDAVYIPLPNELHKRWVCAAADAGKHILCEKPLALTSVDAREMVDYCRVRGVVLMEAFMWRHQPRTIGILNEVASGLIGELRLIRSSFSFSIDMNDWRLDPTRGGGALWDVGCYGVSTTRLFARSEPESIRSRARFGPTGVDLSLTAELKFPNGVLGLIDCSFEQPFRCTYELVGTQGSIEVPDAYLPPETRSIARVIVKGKSRELEFENTNQYSAMVDAFGLSVASGGKLLPPSEDGLAQSEALDAILAAAHRN